MTRKLMLLNLLLVALLGAAGWQLRERWRETQERHDAQLKRLVPSPPTPAVPVVEGVKPVDAPSYSDVAMKMLFSKDRNPNVVIEEIPPPKPDPVPDFPAVFGVMEIGGPITVFMTEGGTSTTQKGYRPGDTVGPFKLVSATRSELVFSWKDQKFNKTVAELRPKPGQQAAESTGPSTPSPQAAQVARPAGPQKSISELQKDMIKDGMIDTGAVNRACMQGDSSPAGTVQAGYRKVIRPSMFGQACYWEPVR